MTVFEIPDAWTNEAEAAKKARFEIDGMWYHYEAVMTIVRKAIAAELRRLADEHENWTDMHVSDVNRARADEIEEAS